MKRYRVTGKPAGAPVELIHSRALGDEFDAELDKDLERSLIDAGALSVVKHSVKADKQEEAESPKATESEAK